MVPQCQCVNGQKWAEEWHCVCWLCYVDIEGTVLQNFDCRDRRETFAHRLWCRLVRGYVIIVDCLKSWFRGYCFDAIYYTRNKLLWTRYLTDVCGDLSDKIYVYRFGKKLSASWFLKKSCFDWIIRKVVQERKRVPVRYCDCIQGLLETSALRNIQLQSCYQTVLMKLDICFIKTSNSARAVASFSGDNLFGLLHTSCSDVTMRWTNVDLVDTSIGGWRVMSTNFLLIVKILDVLIDFRQTYKTKY